MTSSTPAPQKPLEREMAKYREILPSLATSEGRYVVIVGDDVVGVYNDYGDALAAGYKLAGTGAPFLAKQIRLNEPPTFIRGIVA